MTSPGMVELEIPARPEFLSLARVVVAAAASVETALPDHRISDLRLAVSEATTNAIEAHLAVASEERIVIRCRLGDDQVEVEIRDHGHGFNPQDLPELPDVTDPDRLNFERGLGLHLMHVFVDETEIEPSGDGTSVRLTVHTHPKGPRP